MEKKATKKISIDPEIAQAHNKPMNNNRTYFAIAAGVLVLAVAAWYFLF